MNLSSAPQFTACITTPHGRGAVATLSLCLSSTISWDEAAAVLGSLPFLPVNQKRWQDQVVNRTVFGRWGTKTVEEVVVCRIEERCWEVHCHGGIAAAERILQDCVQAGACHRGWELDVESRRGFFHREWGVALSLATSLRSAQTLLAQDANWQQFISDLRVDILQSNWDRARESLNLVHSWEHYARHLIQPFRVVLTGRPNVGKSSLINALVGYQRSIVFDAPGTTRDVVTAEAVWDGWPVELADTAGIRNVVEGLEAAGIDRALQHLEQADLILQILDPSDLEISNEGAEAEVMLYGLSKSVAPRLRVLNKSDLLNPDRAHFENVDLTVSALSGKGIDALVDQAVELLITAQPAAQQAIPFTSRLVEWLFGLRTLIDHRRPQLEMLQQIDLLRATA